MGTLEALQPNASIGGILPDCLVTVVSVQWFGSEALELTYKDPAGKVANQLLYRHDEPRLDVAVQGRPWSFDGDGHLFRLVSEAHRIRLAHLFDPVLAVHTSVVEPLPHQITAVYEAMLPRQPLRFLLADDPGAGKTIMAGLLLEVTHVPAPVRQRDRLIGIGEPVLPRYERVGFEKTPIAPPGQPLAAFVCPGHPLLDATLDLISERHRDLLRRGTALVDERDPGTLPRLLFYLEHAIQDAGLTRAGARRVVSKRLLYVEMDATGAARHLHYAPYLDYRPLRPDEPGVEAILTRPECAWISRDLEQKAQAYAITTVVPEHFEEMRTPRLARIARTEAAVKDRLTKEISYWDHRAEVLKLQEQAGKRADGLEARLQKRMEELKLEANLSPLPPVILGGLLVIPAGLLAKLSPATVAVPAAAQDTQASAARARAIVMAVERRLGFQPADRETEKLGYDIESRVPGTGKLRFIEVKGRVSGADTITVTRNEILYSLNKPDDFILAIVEFMPDDTHRLHYVRRPFQREPDFGVTSVNYSFAELLARAREPS